MAEEPENQSPRSRFSSTVLRIAHEVDDEGSLPRGDIAALRREDGARSPTFYKLAAHLLEDELARYQGEAQLVEGERRWARIVHALAMTGGQHRAGASSFGAILARAELSEPRFLRLLRSEGEAFDAAARAALAPLIQKALVFDPFDLAALVLSAPHRSLRFHFEDSDAVRRRVARDFYRTQLREDEASQSE